MDRRALIAIVISIAILIVYQEFVLKRYYPAPPPRTGSPQAEAPVPELADEIPPVADEVAPAPEPAPMERKNRPVNAPEITVDTDLYTAVVSAGGGRLRSFELKKYRATNERDSPPLELVQPGPDGDLPLGVELRGGETISDDEVVYEITQGAGMHLTGAEEGNLTLTWRGPGIVLEKRFHFTGNQYAVGFEVATLEKPADVQEIGVSWVKGIDPAHRSGRVFEGALALLNDKVVRRKVDDLEKGEILSGNLSWAGYGDTYFLSALIPESGENNRLWLKLRGRTAEVRILVRAVDAQVIPFEFYAGPKDVEILEAVGFRLERAIDFGYFAFIALPLLRVLRLSHAVTSNYGIDIILLTIAIKILFIPLTQKSFKSMKEMQKLQPQMTKLREKYKDNPQEMNKEVMELYRRHKVNPLGGCLPMVLQIPVFLGLYNTLLNSIELRHAPFFLWITDLSQPDRLGSVTIPFVEPAGIPVLTLVMGVSMLVQQWISPSAGDPMQQRMMMIMPLVFTFMFINFPAGLVLYWLVNNVLTIAQQYFIVRSGK